MIRALMKRSPRSARFDTLRRVLVLSGLLFISTSVAAGNTSDKPVAESPIARLLDAPDRSSADLERDLTSAPAAIVEFAGILPGMRVLDLYSGGGYWSELFAEAVGPRGRVLAHSSAAYREFTGDMAATRFANHRIPRVTTLESEVDDLKLGHARFDVIFVSLTYHDLYYYADVSPIVGRERFLQQVRDALKADGTVVVVDHAAAADRGPRDAQTLHRIEESYLRHDFEANGFTFDAASEVLRNPRDQHTLDVFDPSIRGRTDRFVLRFKRAPDGAPETDE